MTLGRERVRLGEPVVVAVSLINCSNEPREVEDLLDPAYGFLQLSVSPPGEPGRVACRPAVRREARGKRSRTLAPRERLSAWAPIFAGADGWVLGKAGQYQVHAQYGVEQERPAATPVALTVAPPESAQERSAAELMMDRASTLMLLTGQDQGGRGRSRLGALVRDHPKSPLAPYAGLALASACLQEGFDPLLKNFRNPDCRCAVELLRPAVARIADPFLAASGTRSLAGCLRKLGHDAEAEEAVRGYGAAHPGGQELPGVRDAISGTDAQRGR